jgi:hypothetical protein
MTTLVAGILAGVLAVVTGVGVVKALNDDTTDRVAPSSTAPVYGSR